MGLSNWRGDKPRKQDVGITKNYLNENELLALNNMVEQYIVFAEGHTAHRYVYAGLDKKAGWLSCFE